MKPCHASYDRFRNIKEQYSYIFGIKHLCAKIERLMVQQDDLDVYYCNGIFGDTHESELPERCRVVLEEFLSYCRFLHSKLGFNPELDWLLVIAGNLATKSSNDDVAVKILTGVGECLTDSCDVNIISILGDIQDILLDHAQDSHITLLCRWLDSMLRQMGFSLTFMTVYWLGETQDAASSIRTFSDFQKLQRAMDFITGIRYKNRRKVLLSKDDLPTVTEILDSTDIDCLCDMAFQVLTLLPSIDDKLSCFLTEECEKFAEGCSVWWKRDDILTIDSEDLERFISVPESASLN